MTDAVFNADQLREDIDLEAKSALGQDGRGALPKDFFETYSAFANSDGGMIYLGVKELKDRSFDAHGIEDPDPVLDDLWNQLNNPQKVSRNLLTPDMVRRFPAASGRWVIEIEVPRATRQERPIYLNGNPLTGTYKRHHSGDFHCREDEVKRMLAEQTEDARDARLLTGYTFDDLEMDTFKAYRNRLAALKPDHPFNGAENLEFLRKLGGWKKDRHTGQEGLTLAGLLMFGKHEAIHEVLPRYFVDYRELPVGGTKTKWVDRLSPDGTWSGNLYDFYRLTIQRLFRDLKVPFRLEGDEREDDTPVHKALREALVNALVHADYSASISILVVKAPDYFGFRNPGKMRIPVEKALEGGHSDCRNRSLQKMFSLIGLGEQAGSGIPRVLENWKSQHYRFPELWESEEPEATLMRLRTVSLLPDATLDDLRELFGPDFDRLNENERLALATAHIEGFVTNTRVQQISRLHRRDITALLKGLVDRRMLVPDGRGRATSYRLAGAEAVDLAGAVDLENPTRRSEHLDPSSSHLGGSSPHLNLSSSHLDPRSEGPATRSEGLVARSEGSATSSEDYDPVEDPMLREMALPVSSKSRIGSDVFKNTLLRLCTARFLTLNELAALLNRNPVDLRQRYIKPMVDVEKTLERRFPQQPNHEQQAYRTREP
jgi:predicted HTH transcriptional regulator